MTLTSLTILLAITVIAIQFWRLRGIAEYSIEYAKRYCENNGLQYMSLARKRTRITGKYGKLDWEVEYDFEFSSNGEDAYLGTIISVGKHIVSTELPVYKVQ